ncbi:MAG: peptide ABC transporter substrate-binding protein [Anaerofustis sp.]
MKKLVVILLTGLMVFSIFGCSGKKVDELDVCVGPEPATIDPALNSSVDGATLIIHAFEGLYKLDDTGKTVPGQAESYTVSSDGLTYTFKLRNDIKWSDGQAVTAKDFAYSWNRAIDPATAADYAYMFEPIKGYEDGKLDVTAVDNTTLQVVLTAPCQYFLELVAFPAYMPVRQDVVEANPDGWALDPSTYICNGPYVLKEWSHDSYMLYDQNQYYYDVKSLGPKSIKFVLMDDDNAQLAAFQSGELQMIDSVPQDEIDSLSSNPEFHKQGQLGTYYVAFNNQVAPFDNEKVREALSLVIDRNYIVEQIGKAGQLPAGAFVCSGLSDADTTKDFRTVGGDYYSVSAADYQANCDKARELLAEAGYPNGAGFPTFEYLTNNGTGHVAIAEALQQMWKDELGINCTISTQEWNTFLETRKKGDYQVCRDGWLGDYNDPYTFLSLFTSDSGNNDAQFHNADFDALISQIMTETDRDKRFQMMHEAEDILMNANAIAPIYYYVDIYMLSDKVEGFYSSPLGFKYFMYVTMN